MSSVAPPYAPTSIHPGRIAVGMLRCARSFVTTLTCLIPHSPFRGTAEKRDLEPRRGRHDEISIREPPLLLLLLLRSILFPSFFPREKERSWKTWTSLVNRIIEKEEEEEDEEIQFEKIGEEKRKNR